MVKLYLDIETIQSNRHDLHEHFSETIKPPGTLKKQASIDAWWADKSNDAVQDKLAKTSLSGDYGELISISSAIDDDEIINHYRMPGIDEGDLLSNLMDDLRRQLDKRQVSVWVGHNIAAFDLPLIYKRCIINGLLPPNDMPVNPNAWDRNVFDTMHEWAGRNNRISQDELCFILGIEQKPSDINGANVGQHYIDGNHEKIISYNNYDVETVRRIEKRLTQS